MFGTVAFLDRVKIQAIAGVYIGIEPAKGGDAETIACDVVLVSIGRTPYTEGLGLKEAGVDVANPVLFLCSSGSEFITGQTLVVDGGASII